MGTEKKIGVVRDLQCWEQLQRDGAAVTFREVKLIDTLVVNTCHHDSY
jgi:hypothetical protein